MQIRTTLGSLGNYLLRDGTRRFQAQLINVLDQTGKGVQKESINMIGKYQSGNAPFDDWAPLKQSTLERKSRAPYNMSNPDQPLLRTGKFKRSIRYTINRREHSVTIGTSLAYIVHTELGTKNMPPRPVFAPAAKRVLPQMTGLLAQSAAAAFSGDNGFSATAFAGGRIYGSGVI